MEEAMGLTATCATHLSHTTPEDWLERRAQRGKHQDLFDLCTLL
jgi:hypothetical protein